MLFSVVLALHLWFFLYEKERKKVMLVFLRELYWIHLWICIHETILFAAIFKSYIKIVILLVTILFLITERPLPNLKLCTFSNLQETPENISAIFQNLKVTTGNLSALPQTHK